MASYEVTGLVGFHLYDAARYARESWSTPELNPHDLDRVTAYFDTSGASPTLDGFPTVGQFAGSNVLVVQVEALQALAVGHEIGGQAVTPTLDGLADDSITFEHFFHQTATGHTSDAEFLTTCSLYPAHMGSAFFRFADDDLACMPELLADYGYSSAAHHAYYDSFWNRNSMYEAIGYDRFFAGPDYELDEPLGWSLGDRSFLRQTVAQLESRPKPFYDTAITLTSHHPYTLAGLETDLDAGQFRRRFSPTTCGPSTTWTRRSVSWWKS